MLADFGYQLTGAASIGDKVFEDIGNDGVYNAGTDVGISGVTVYLYEDTDGDGVITPGIDTLVATTTTDEDGNYSFTGLAEGYDYIVTVDPDDSGLAVYFDEAPYQPSTPIPHPVANLTGTYNDADFGFWEVEPGSIGDQVFIDNNGDGVYSSGDTPLAGVTVNLYRDGNLVATTVTGPDGKYFFANLGPGDYTVVVDAASAGVPAGYAPTIRQYTKTLAAGEDCLTADFPFVPLIAKTVNKNYVDPSGTEAERTLTFGVTVNYPADDHLDGVKVIDLLPDGVTYVSSSANAGGAYGPYTSQAGVPGEGTVSNSGMAIYSINSNTPNYRLWDGSEFNASGTASQNIGNTPRVLVGASAPTRDEKIVVAIINGESEVRGLKWDGAEWGYLAQPPAFDAAGSLANLEPTDTRNRWSGAVAYEQSSGDALLVWSNSSSLAYNTWNGTSWALDPNGALALPTGITAQPDQMRLAARPGSDEMVLVVSNLNARDYAYVWNGSAWSAPQVLDNCGTAPCGSNTSVFVAYEQQSGEALVVYGKSGDERLYYRTWNGSTWSSEGSVDPDSGASGTNPPLWVSLASDPTSDRIAVGVVSTGRTWLAVWDGSAWGSIQTATTAPLLTTALNVGVSFETQSGDLLAVYGKSGDNTVYHRTWTSGGGWSGENIGANLSERPNVIVLSRSPSSDRIRLTTNDNGSDANYTVWNGSVWEAPFEAIDNTGSNSNQPALFLWDQHLEPSTSVTVSASPTTVALGNSTTVQIVLRSTKTITNVTPSLSAQQGSATCATADTIPANVLAGVAKTFTYTCTPTTLGEIHFVASASGAGGYTFSAAESNTVLVSANGASNVVTWNLGSTTPGVPVSTATSKYIYASQGNDNLTFWAYNTATGNWNNPADPADTPSGVTIKEGGALTNDGRRYIYALRGDNTRVFLRYDAQTPTWDDAGIADLPATTDKTVLKGGALVYLNGNVYAFLGNDSQEFWRYSVSGNSWMQMASTPTGGTVNTGAGLTTDGAYIYGMQGDGKMGFWRYNPATNVWLTLASTLDSIGDGGGLVYANGAIYALRGGGKPNFYRYNIAANNWTRLTSTAANIDDGGVITFDG